VGARATVEGWVSEGSKELVRVFLKSKSAVAECKKDFEKV
jgi:hypothetical protein